MREFNTGMQAGGGGSSFWLGLIVALLMLLGVAMDSGGDAVNGDGHHRPARKHSQAKSPRI